jgi:hypothetical protein
MAETTSNEIKTKPQKRRVVYPSGKPMIPHFLRCQGFAVAYYGFTLDALDLQHPRLLEKKGCFRPQFIEYITRWAKTPNSMSRKLYNPLKM